MKNNKILKNILLPVVAVIWGLIFWQIFGGPGEGDLYTEHALDQPVVDLTISTDSFEIENNYSDPFLDRQLIGSGKSIAQSAPKLPPGAGKPPPVKPKIPTQWPKIDYHGLVKSLDKQADKSGIVTVEDRQLSMSEGDILKDVEVVTFWNDSCEVRYRDETRRVYVGGQFRQLAQGK